MSTLYIKNMVCDRCKLSVARVLDNLQVPYRRIDLGEVELVNEPGEQFLHDFKQQITPLGFELIEDRNSRVISKIKSAVLELVRSGKKTKLSGYLSDAVLKDYNSLSTLFSSVEGITIEQYFILQKIEYVKELLAYDELSLSEIAYKLQYSSVQHLSNQFKKVTGLTPTRFKLLRSQRISLDKV